MVQFYILSLIIDSVSCPDIWNQEPANPVNHHQDRHFKRRFAGQSRSSPPRPSPKPPLRRHMLTSLLPSPPPADGAGGAGDLDVTPSPAAAAAAGKAPAASSPAAAAVAAARGWQRRGQWQGRRRQEYQGMNKRVCACNDLKQKPLLVQSMQRFQKSTEIGRPPCPPHRGPAQMQTVY